MSQRRRAPVPPRFKNFEEVWQAFLELSRAMNANLEQGSFVASSGQSVGDNQVVRGDGSDGALQGSAATVDDNGALNSPVVKNPYTTLISNKLFGGDTVVGLEVTATDAALWRLYFTSAGRMQFYKDGALFFGYDPSTNLTIIAKDFVFKLGDAAGANELRVIDSASSTVFSVNSDGKVRVLQGGAAFTFNAETGIGVQNNSGTDKGAILSLIGGETTGNSQIAFGDKDNEFAGRLLYFHADNRFEFRVNGSATPVVTITSAGRLKLGSASGPDIITGTGTPEGVVTAVVGSLFLRTDGGAGTSFYVKESGSGNTGWAAK